MRTHYRAHQLSVWLRLIPKLHAAGSSNIFPQVEHDRHCIHGDQALGKHLFQAEILSVREITGYGTVHCPQNKFIQKILCPTKVTLLISQQFFLLSAAQQIFRPRGSFLPLQRNCPPWGLCAWIPGHILSFVHCTQFLSFYFFAIHACIFFPHQNQVNRGYLQQPPTTLSPMATTCLPVNSRGEIIPDPWGPAGDSTGYDN